jgi:hypothetical protein
MIATDYPMTASNYGDAQQRREVALDGLGTIERAGATRGEVDWTAEVV